MQRSEKIVGRLYVLAAALLWSTSGFFAKSPFFEDWSPLERGPMLAFWRVFFAGIVLLPFVGNVRWRPTLVPLAFAFSGMNIFYVSALAMTTAANAIWMQASSPWWAFFFAILIFHEAFYRRDLIPLAFGGTGVGLILYYEILNSNGQSITGSCLGLFSGVASAGVYVCMRHLRHENPIWLVAFCHIIAAMILLPWILYHWLLPSTTQLLVLATFGIFQMGTPYLLLAHGLKRIGSVEAITIGLLEPVLLPIWVFLAWGEIPAWWSIAGAACILTGLILRYFVLSDSTLEPEKQLGKNIFEIQG